MTVIASKVFSYARLKNPESKIHTKPFMNISQLLQLGKVEKIRLVMMCTPQPKRPSIHLHHKVDADQGKYCIGHPDRDNGRDGACYAK